MTDVWFIGSGGDGFTRDSTQALLDKDGAPVMANGTLVQIVKLEQARTAKRMEKIQDMIWNRLFDTYETIQTSGPHATGLSVKMGEMDGLMYALAVLQHGNGEEENIKKINEEMHEAYIDDEETK